MKPTSIFTQGEDPAATPSLPETPAGLHGGASVTCDRARSPRTGLVLIVLITRAQVVFPSQGGRARMMGVSNNYHRSLNSRVADVRRVSGFSATGILDLLRNDYADDNDDDNDVEDREVDASVDSDEIDSEARHEVQDDTVDYDDKDRVGDYDDCNDDDDDDHMSFCELGFLLDEVEAEEEGWCLLAQS